MAPYCVHATCVLESPAVSDWKIRWINTVEIDLHIQCFLSDPYYLCQICLNIDVSMFKKRLDTCNVSTNNMDQRE
ncbi:hypothetical protein BRADI_2g58945v3 [Brachypodium distachyon]|uniref:Uncharacterized protein n=1 Tax=Brachypodium distachyon TaxID=15368 RepID=A0A2K2DGR5_BRADI|nr:hypothetical protein BRADI_2g58945v3 [Brachypodium distachyon]